MNGRPAAPPHSKRVARHPRLEGVELPENTDSELYVPCRPSFYGFCMLRQKEDLLKDVSNVQINETLAKINKVVDLLLISQRQKDRPSRDSLSQWLFGVCATTAVLLCILSLILVVNNVPNFRSTYIYIPLAFVVAATAVCVGVVLRNVAQVKQDVSLDGLVSRAIDRILKRENQMHYNSKGYLFEKNENLYWLCLRKVF